VVAPQKKREKEGGGRGRNASPSLSPPFSFPPPDVHASVTSAGGREKGEGKGGTRAHFPSWRGAARSSDHDVSGPGRKKEKEREKKKGYHRLSLCYQLASIIAGGTEQIREKGEREKGKFVLLLSSSTSSSAIDQQSRRLDLYNKKRGGGGGGEEERADEYLNSYRRRRIFRWKRARSR